MHRHRRVAPQPAALRGTVTQVHGVTTSAVSNERKPPAILGEGTITRVSGGSRGPSRARHKGGVTRYVVRVGGRHRPPPAGPRASGPRPPHARPPAGGGVAALSL